MPREHLPQQGHVLQKGDVHRGQHQAVQARGHALLPADQVEDEDGAPAHHQVEGHAAEHHVGLEVERGVGQDEGQQHPRGDRPQKAGQRALGPRAEQHPRQGGGEHDALHRQVHHPRLGGDQARQPREEDGGGHADHGRQKGGAENQLQHIHSAAASFPSCAVASRSRRFFRQPDRKPSATTRMMTTPWMMDTTSFCTSVIRHMMSAPTRM